MSAAGLSFGEGSAVARALDAEQSLRAPIEMMQALSSDELTAGKCRFEREIMLERQREGVARAKAEGKYRGGRRRRSARLPR